MSKVDKSSASRFFYSFGTVFLFAVLTICIINFTRDGRIFEKAAVPVKTETSVSSGSAAEGTIKVDTSSPGKSSKSVHKNQTKHSSQSKAPSDAGSGSDGTVQPAAG